MRITPPALAIVAFFVASAARAAGIPPLVPPAETVRVPARAPLFDRSTATEIARLTPPARATPAASGLVREADVETLHIPIELPARRTAMAAALPGSATLLGKIVVDGAATVRLNVSGAARGTVLWVAGSDDAEFVRFDADALHTWSPTLRGTVVYIAAERVESDLRIEKLAIGRMQAAGAITACLRDAVCAAEGEDSELLDASRAIALIRFIRGDASYVCTGGLVNDVYNSRTPYLLTAAHCISTPEEAASVEAVWNYRSETCGAARAMSPVVRTYGAELLVASAETDVALLRLGKVPADRLFLGVDLSAPAPGTSTYRLSHANGTFQTWSAGTVHDAVMTCDSNPRPDFIYTRPIAGAIASGSSGAPLLVPGLRVTGQLVGLCGPPPGDSCAYDNDAVDGSIAASWPLLATWLDPPQPARRRAAGR